jgi:hypothetical protein
LTFTSGLALWKPARQASIAFSCEVAPAPFRSPLSSLACSGAPDVLSPDPVGSSDPQAARERATAPVRAIAPIRPWRESFTVFRPVDQVRTDVCAATLTVGSARDRVDGIR